MFGASSELAPNIFGASSELASVMEFGFKLLQKFPQSAIDFVFFTDEKMSSVASPDSRQNKVSGRLR